MKQILKFCARIKTDLSLFNTILTVASESQVETHFGTVLVVFY